MSLAAVRNTKWSYVLDEPTKVLIADDDPILREFASVHLSSPAATIETVADGASALAVLNKGEFDVALLDIEMPVLDGFALLEKIRSDPRLSTLSVVMLTGHEDIASIDRAFSLGANSFVTKPVNWRLLSYHVRYVLRTSGIERDLRQATGDAEAKEANHLRSLLALEVEARAVLRSIVQHAARCREGDASPSQQSAQACLEQIEQLAAAAMGSWNELAGGSTGAESAQPALESMNGSRGRVA
jgi:two-component system sensor histidine kinase/response regulator